jgi:DNA-binding response OmpR family regulator
MRILWVDDELPIREIGAAWLVRAGHTVDTAGNNKEALAHYENGHYDLVLTDAEHLEDVGPDGEEGLELARVVRKRNPGQSIGFITAHRYDITGYPTLHKPFEPEQLLRFVNELSQTDSVRR